MIALVLINSLSVAALASDLPTIIEFFKTTSSSVLFVSFTLNPDYLLSSIAKLSNSIFPTYSAKTPSSSFLKVMKFFQLIKNDGLFENGFG